MGKKSRSKRAEVKRFLRKNPGYTTDEFGELKKKVSKQEARERLARGIRMRWQVEREIVEVATRTAMNEIQSLEDAKVFRDLDLAAEAL